MTLIPTLMAQRSAAPFCALVLSTLACGQGSGSRWDLGARVTPGANQGQQLQGQQLQGRQLQGRQLQGTTLVGTAPTDPPFNSSYSGWWNNGWLGTARIVQGQLVAQGRQGTLSGSALAGTWIPADDVGTRTWTVVRSVTPDPTYADGSTLLYAIDVYDPATGTFSPLCATDVHNVAAAIPIAATFDGAGKRVESTTQFTFGCTGGVIAKCYRWGYRPWLTDAAGSSREFSTLHWACTRMARADYCGDGRTWTHTGTLINIWDSAPAPGPFQDHGPADPTFFFEAGWTTGGAACLSKQRWATLDPKIAQNCPNRLIAPGAITAAGTVCDTESQALGFDRTTKLFNESKVNVAP